MTRTEIEALKAAVQELYPEASRLQYHEASDTVSGYGWQLTTPRHAVGNIDRYGNGRYVIATLDPQGDWNDQHGNPIRWGTPTVFWYSPRGFANEGAWVYGHLSDVRRHIRSRTDENTRYHRESNHRTIEAARRAAIDLARNDRRSAPRHEICAIGAYRAPDALSDYERQDDIDADVITYGWQADR